jgi:5-methylcytosine-specific restriction enzyme A
MTSRRGGPRSPHYRTGFLHSPAWRARRGRWFTREARYGRVLACAACMRPAASADLELHHLDYRGVTYRDGSWRAFENHADLLPIHPYCHELLHRLLDRDRALANRNRRAASLQALARLRTALNARSNP